MDTKDLLFALLRAAVCGASAEELKTACTAEVLARVHALASYHDLAHLVGQAVGTISLEHSDALDKCKQASLQAFGRYMLQNNALSKICIALENAEIPFIPLKGSVLRAYYPEPWMRSSSDLDILVQQKDLETAAQILLQDLSCTYHGKTPHDVSLFTPDGVHLELHYSTIEDFISKESEQILSQIWDSATPCEGKTYQLQIPDALFYYYHIAHMAKHFIHGGCGIRPLLDLWILDTKQAHDVSARNVLLEKGKLLVFANSARKLSRVWFSQEAYDDLSLQMEQFLLRGGTFGTLANNVAVHQAQEGGKVRYALSRVFLSYDTMKNYYPVLKTKKWLLPFYHVRRWFKITFLGGANSAIAELQANAALPGSELDATAKMLRRLGLKK